MELRIRATQLAVVPSDASGFLVTVECADAEDVRGQVLRTPDDAADDWPLAKRYAECCDEIAKLRVELAGIREGGIERFANGMAAVRRCSTCYRKGVDPVKFGPYCHRCGGGEELT